MKSTGCEPGVSNNTPYLTQSSVFQPLGRSFSEQKWNLKVRGIFMQRLGMWSFDGIDEEEFPPDMRKINAWDFILRVVLLNSPVLTARA